jgi:glucosamine--fructose-6-phosphate aminotransferase (isomerizing)
MTTHFLRDILRQPEELQRAIDFLLGAGEKQLKQASAAVRGAGHIYLTGIGSSWNAALAAAPLFQQHVGSVYLQDASELLHFGALPPRSLVIVASRSGRSVEIVKLLVKARESDATVIGITNSADGPLALEAEVPIIIPTRRDHGISVNTYITLAAATGALAASVGNAFDVGLSGLLRDVLVETKRKLPEWRAQLPDHAWVAAHSATYFLGRGSGLGSCNEARLLWEEGAKLPATAMGTGSFRHGPQEMVGRDLRFGLWIDGQRMRAQDLSVAADLRRLGASVMVIGQEISSAEGDLVFALPSIPPEWQFLIDIIPAQLAAESVAQRLGVDCDAFRICSYIVEDEYGLIAAKAATQEN